MLKQLLPHITMISSLPALTIQIDYTYDSSNFFNTQEKRDAIEAVADFFGQMIKDDLARIDVADFAGTGTTVNWSARPKNPSTGLDVSIPNLVVPEDTLIVYVGARDLDGNTLGLAGPGGVSYSGSGSGFYLNQWASIVRSRGEAGADFDSDDDPDLFYDFGPWGGSIAFDSETNWNFSLTDNLPGVDFVSVALHEMGHVLGIGTAPSWDNLIINGLFTGDNVSWSNGEVYPPVQSTGGHFYDSSQTLTSVRFGSFGTTHGVSQPLSMLPSGIDNGVDLEVFTDLDLAALVDIGWTVEPAVSFDYDFGNSTPSFSWPSVSFLDYRVTRGTSLDGFSDGSSLFFGNGVVQTWDDPSPPDGKAFYRLVVTQPNSGPVASSQTPNPPGGPSQNVKSNDAITKIEFTSKPRVVTGCGCPNSH